MQPSEEIKQDQYERLKAALSLVISQDLPFGTWDCLDCCITFAGSWIDHSKSCPSCKSERILRII